MKTGNRSFEGGFVVCERRLASRRRLRGEEGKRKKEKKRETFCGFIEMVHLLWCKKKIFFSRERVSQGWRARPLRWRYENGIRQ